MPYLADTKGRKIPDSEVSEEEVQVADLEDLIDRDENIAEAYLRELAKIPLLTKEREVELGKRIQRGERKISNLILKCSDAMKRIDQTGRELYRDKGESRDETQSREETIKQILQRVDRLPLSLGGGSDDLGELVAQLKTTVAEVNRAKAEMTQANLRLVVCIAKVYVNRGLSFLDLIQEGNLGLMKAVTRYDYRRGFRFSTYASWWIRQAIIRALINKSKIIRIPAHMLEMKRKIDKASDQLIKELGGKPLPETIAQKAGVTSNDVLKVVDLKQEPISLETPFGEEGGKLEDFIVSEEWVSLSEDLHRDMDVARTTEDLLSLLKPREEQILRLRFGIGEPTSYTLDEIGKRFGISRERVRQIENRALERLKTRPIRDTGDISV